MTTKLLIRKSFLTIVSIPAMALVLSANSFAAASSATGPLDCFTQLSKAQPPQPAYDLHIDYKIELCQGAKDASPVTCYNTAMKAPADQPVSELAVVQKVALCAGAVNNDTIDCYNTASQPKGQGPVYDLSIMQKIKLCSHF